MVIFIAFCSTPVFSQKCVIGGFIVNCSKEEPKEKPKETRGKTKSTTIGISAYERGMSTFKGKKDGFEFEDVTFNYQFANCGGEVQMGVSIYSTYDTGRKYFNDGGKPIMRNMRVFNYVYKDQRKSVLRESDEVEILEIEADLYLYYSNSYKRQHLGKVNLNNIVGNFAGCFGETYEVIKQVGLDPSKKEYLENLDEFELVNIRILRGDVKISAKERLQIERSFDYDEYGNPRNPEKNVTKEEPKVEYDSFGNPKKKETGQAPKKVPKKEPKKEPKQKYDEFGNPIKDPTQSE